MPAPVRNIRFLHENVSERSVVLAKSALTVKSFDCDMKYSEV